ncbi:hypothetical protein L917_21569, partial [Phytophthora nicotianae]
SQLARSQSDLQVARDRQSALASELRESATSHKAAQAEVVRLEAAIKRKNGRLQDRVSAARDTIARLEKWVNQVEKSQKTRQDIESALTTLQQEKDALAVQRDELLGQLGERFMEVTDLRAERDQAQERLSNIASLLPSAPSHKRERSGSESPTQSARVSKAARSTSGPSPAGASSRVPASGSSIEVLSAGAASQTAERSVASHSSAGPPDHLPRSVRSATKRGSRDASSSPAAPEADVNSDGDESSSGESGSTHVLDSDTAGSDSCTPKSSGAKNEFGMPSGPLSDAELAALRFLDRSGSPVIAIVTAFAATTSSPGRHRISGRSAS